MAQGCRTVDAVFAQSPRESGFRIEKVVFLVDVQFLVVVAARAVVELVVDSVGLVANVAILNVGKHVPVVGYVECRLCKRASVGLCRVRIVIVVSAVFQECGSNILVGNISDVAEVVSAEILHSHAAYDVPAVALVACVPHQSVGILLKAFLAHKVASLNCVAVGISIFQTELGKFVVVAELVVISVAVSVACRCRCAPVVVYIPCKRQNVVVLPEVVGRSAP